MESDAPEWHVLGLGLHLPVIRASNTNRKTTSFSSLTAKEASHSPVSTCDIRCSLKNELIITLSASSTACRAAQLFLTLLPVSTSYCEGKQSASASLQETVIAGKGSASFREGASNRTAQQQTRMPPGGRKSTTDIERKLVLNDKIQV